jgi:hypothetical protein
LGKRKSRQDAGLIWHYSAALSRRRWQVSNPPRLMLTATMRW